MHSEAHLLEGRPGVPWGAGTSQSAGSCPRAPSSCTPTALESQSCAERPAPRMLGAAAARRVPAASHPPHPPKPGRASRRSGNGPQGPPGRWSSGGDAVAVTRRQGTSFWSWGRPPRAAGRAQRGGRSLESQRGPPEQPDSWCLWSRDIREKVLEHVLHWYFLTSEWVWRWARRLERSAKARLQWGHEKGFSPGER